MGVRNVAAPEVDEVIVREGHCMDMGGECLIEGKSEVAKICCGSIGHGVIAEQEEECHGCFERSVVKCMVLVGREGPKARPGEVKRYGAGAKHGKLVLIMCSQAVERGEVVVVKVAW